MKRNIGIIGVIILIILCITNIIRNTETNKDQIVFGSILIQTGEGASWGEASLNGVDLAIQDINQHGGLLGKQVKVIHEDDQGDPKKTVSAFRKLTEINGVDFIIGPTWSNVGLSIIDLIDNEVVVSPSLGKAEFNESSDYVFNTWMHDYILSENVAEYVYNKGYRKIVILGANDVWVNEQTSAVESKFRELGGEISYQFEPTPDRIDMRTELIKIRNMNADAIVITSDGYDITSRYGRQLSELDIVLPVFGITFDENVLQNCASACDGWVYLSGLTPLKDFELRYKDVYNRSIEVGADSAYDAVMMIAEAINETGSTEPEKIKDYLNDIREYNGVSGRLVSDGKGGFTKGYKIFKVENGVSTEISH
ncbi:ABC transporter substrate-binding protein [Patescibacteria group bacterium]|nr:ABC transporter substrate-binding protein [Patescibacteria group bacterium]